MVSWKTVNDTTDKTVEKTVMVESLSGSCSSRRNQRPETSVAEHFKVIIIFDLAGVLLDDEMALLITSFKTIFSHTPNSIGSEAGSGGRIEKPLTEFPFNDICHLLWTLDVKCGFFEISRLKL